MSDKLNEEVVFFKGIEEKEKVKSKWGEFVEGINDDFYALQVAQLFENVTNAIKKKMQFMEAVEPNASLSPVNQGTISEYPKYLFPIMKGVLRRLEILNRLVSIQSLTQPEGIIAWMDIIAGINKGSVSAGDTIVPGRDAYNGAKVNYTSEYIDGELSVDITTDGSGNFGNTTINFGFSPLRKGSVKIVLDDGAGHTATLQENSAGGFDVDLSGASVTVVSFDRASGILVISGTSFDASITYHSTLYYDYNSEANRQKAIYKIKFNTERVTTAERKVEYEMSFENFEDVLNIFGVNPISTLEDAIADNIANDIFYEVVKDIYNTALTSGGYTTTFDMAISANGITKTDHYADLLLTVEQVDRVLSNKIMVAERTFLLVSPKTASIFGSTKIGLKPEFSVYGGNASGMNYIGTINNKVDIIEVANLIPDNKIVVGKSSTNPFKKGYIYAPYILLKASSMLEDPRTDTYIRSFRTRYGKKLVSPNYYGIINLLNW